ncbi:DUF3108 domain-containing protein [Moraxella cuniculi]|uniref:Protein of uncharacterized function (DUF3108) n=1 Tax=Moraxella cuniculi TaxID=34061 RepID=A0A3S4T0J5_9GAMM|nr:DUF3108 domain-containing protein [Moraxella cuniculi]VEG14005.1 Protein of uncharacterised function (DUF3108) [Moraxella cuniculi]
MKRANFLKALFTSTAVAGTTSLSTLATAGDLAAFSATYKVSADGKTGTATRTLTKNANSYQYSVNARAAGISTLNQEAKFSLNGGQIIPNSAKLSMRILGVGYTHEIRFNHTNKSVISTYKNNSTTLAMPKQAFDDLSLEAQIRQELLNGKFTGNYLLVKRSQIENTKFKRTGNTKITVPAGTYDTIRIDRIHDDKDRATSFWLAPTLNYLPIKVSQTNDGKTISMELTKIN